MLGHSDNNDISLVITYNIIHLKVGFNKFGKWVLRAKKNN